LTASVCINDDDFLYDGLYHVGFMLGLKDYSCGRKYTLYYWKEYLQKYYTFSSHL